MTPTVQQIIANWIKQKAMILISKYKGLCLGGVVTDQGGKGKVWWFFNVLLIQVMALLKLGAVGNIMNAPTPQPKGVPRSDTWGLWLCYVAKGN